MSEITVNILGGKTVRAEKGITLGEIAKDYIMPSGEPILVAKINNDLQEMHRRVFDDCTVEFLDITDPNGFRVYQRTAAFLMIYAVKEVLGRKTRVVIEHSINKNYYCDIIADDFAITDEIIKKIENKMHEAIRADIPIEKFTLSVDEAIKLSKEFGLEDKVKILIYRRASNVNFYKLDWFYNYFYGHLAPNTGCIKLFKLTRLEDGFVLNMPSMTSPKELGEMKSLKKITKVFQESSEWASILKADTVGALNDIICTNGQSMFVRINEALHEKKIASLADQITGRKSKIALIAGPSSSGKTTFAERLSIQLRVNGLVPDVISLDDYYLNRDKIPNDEYGKPDFETIDAIDVKQINHDLNALINGETVEIPSFNFLTGKREYKGRKISLRDDGILVIEGIHGLNERVSSSIPKELKFKIVISALTQLIIDDHNRIPTSDTRLIRRIVRDSKFRGTNVTKTLAMWPSVLRGEEKYIFPYQEEADAVFNSALVYELCVLKHYVEPVLLGVSQSSPEYTQARRLVKFLDCFIGFSSDDVPPNSILREFIGGSCFRT